MQDGAPIDWFTNASNWLNENLPGRWNGRGGAQDCNITWPLKADRNEATLPRNYCMQPCNAIYAMSNHDVQRLHGKRCTTRLRSKVSPCLPAIS